MVKMGFSMHNEKLWRKNILFDGKRVTVWVDFRKSDNPGIWTQPPIGEMRINMLGEKKVLKAVLSGKLDAKSWNPEEPIDINGETIMLSEITAKKGKTKERQHVDKNKEEETEPEYATEIVEKETPFIPAMEISVEQAKRQLQQLQHFVDTVMVEGEDYGKLPGLGKPSLFKSGAEKLLNVHGMSVHFEEVSSVKDWEKGFFYFEYKCVIRSKKYGDVVAECIGSCNSMEDKYRWRWVVAPQDEQRNWKELKNRDEYKSVRDGDGWILKKRLPNNDPYSLVNTIQKMAQKRALVGATLIATRTSMTFTQDAEDIGGHNVPPTY